MVLLKTALDAYKLSYNKKKETRNTNSWSPDGEKKERLMNGIGVSCDNVSYLNETNNGIQAVVQQLLDTENSAGAHNQQHQAQGSNDKRREYGVIGSNDRQPVLTVRADDRGMKLDSPLGSDNCHLARRT